MKIHIPFNKPSIVGSELIYVGQAVAGGHASGDGPFTLRAQKLMEERFALKYHRETKTLPVYSLTVAKTGMKMTEHTGADGPSTTFRNQSGKLTLSARGQSTAQLTLLLGQRLDRSVIDNTGLTGEYDLSLEWAADEAADSSLPSIFTALQEQVGLRLESTKGPVEVIVIDHVERPSEN